MISRTFYDGTVKSHVQKVQIALPDPRNTLLDEEIVLTCWII